MDRRFLRIQREEIQRQSATHATPEEKAGAAHVINSLTTQIEALEKKNAKEIESLK